MQADPAFVACIAAGRAAFAAVEREAVVVGNFQSGERFFAEAVSERVVFFLGGMIGFTAFSA